MYKIQDFIFVYKFVLILFINVQKSEMLYILYTVCIYINTNLSKNVQIRMFN